MPRKPKKPPVPSSRNARSAAERVLDAAESLRPVPGYVNGDDWEEWYVQATPALLRAMAELALHHQDEELAGRLVRFASPMCLEPEFENSSGKRVVVAFCAEAVAREDEPCPEHHPSNAEVLGYCVHVSGSRLCRTPRAPGKNRCAEHAKWCLAVERDGAVCNRRNCQVPKHRELAREAQEQALV
ncbi:hypothetical protein ACIGHB_29830 [Streptomyces sp. NPDC085460]|uniref:hypothetical protein n=1 Tax=Streptomyces sp. NPDC085460 TaxID=3365723 RepID=UPI0037D62F10